jgi:hypothetical protein
MFSALGERVWKRAIALWRAATFHAVGCEPVRGREDYPPSLAESWDAIDTVSAQINDPGLDWWALPHVTWGDLADRIGVGATSTTYHFGVLGWRFEGTYSGRRVVQAPCVECGEPWPTNDIRRRRGPCCQRTQ